MTVRKILKDISTGIDGETFCYARIAGIAGVIVYLGVAISDFIVNHRFDYMQFGTGFGVIISGVGVGIKLKQDTEPGQL
jgi:hypothetical protein